jgi:hypothetical protein
MCLARHPLLLLVIHVRRGKTMHGHLKNGYYVTVNSTWLRPYNSYSDDLNLEVTYNPVRGYDGRMFIAMT